MVTYKEKAQTYKFKCFVPHTLKNRIGRFGVHLGFIVVIIAMIGFTGMFTCDFFNLEFFLRMSIGIVVFAILIYSALYTTKTAVLTYDELILMKDRIGLLKIRIPYIKIREAKVVEFGPTIESVESAETEEEKSSTSSDIYVPPHLLKKNTSDNKAESIDGLVEIGIEKGKVYKFHIERPDTFLRIIRKKMKEFETQV